MSTKFCFKKEYKKRIEILGALKQGATISSISRNLKVSRNTVRRVRDKGIMRKKRIFKKKLTVKWHKN